MTSLQLNGSAVAASTLAAAGKLFSATGGSSGNTSTKVGSGTQFKQLFAKGTTTNQTGVASIPTPTDSNFNGWMWDVTTLEGQLLQAGTLTPTIHLLASTGTTVTPTVQWFKRTSGGDYTQLASVQGSSIALTTSSQALTFTPPSMADTAFSTGDKLVMWLWVNQTAGGATNSTISVVEATSASSAGVASEVQTVTQGYIPIVTTTYSFTEANTASDSVLAAGAALPTEALFASDQKAYKAIVLADSPIRYYRLDELTGTTATDSSTAAQHGTLNGGVTTGQSSLLADPDPAMLFTSASSGYISLPTTGLPTGASAFSIECWVKFSSVPTAGHYPIALALGTSSADNEAAFYSNGDSSGALNFTLKGIFDLTSGLTVSVGHSYYLAGTYDGTTATFYCYDATAGTADTHSNTSGALNLTYGVATVGVDAGGTLFWDGIIDEPAIYATALSGGQVATHYQAGLLKYPDAPGPSGGTTIPTESLTATESLLVAVTALPTDGLSATESVLATKASSTTDALSASETVVAQGSGLLQEALSVAEAVLSTASSTPLESLSATESLSSAESYLPIEAASVAASLQGDGPYAPLDALAGAETLLDVARYLPTDGLVADDSASTMTQDAVGGGVVTTVYRFEEDLSASDTFLGAGSVLPLEALTTSESVLLETGTTRSEDLSESSVLTGGQSVQVSDALSLAASMAGTSGYSLIEQASLLASLIGIGTSLPRDALSANASLLGEDALAGEEDLEAVESVVIQVIPFYPFFEVLSANSALTVEESAAFIEQTSASDSFLARMWIWNAVVLVRSGQATIALRSGQASVTVRSGQAIMTVRSGQAAILVEEED